MAIRAPRDTAAGLQTPKGARRDRESMSITLPCRAGGRTRFLSV